MMLSINQVTKKYGSKTALDNVSFGFDCGVTGLLGPNGAGKSTLMRMIATVEKPSSGTITWKGADISKNPKQLRRILGYLPQDFGVYPNMNPVEFLEYMAAMKGLNLRSAKKRIDELLETLHLSEARKRMLGGFSGGMRQRVGIAQALLNDPELLIVDEPTVGLDPEERIQFRNLLSSISGNRVIILSTHIVSDIESIAPGIVMLSDGRLLGRTTPEQLIGQAEGSVWNCVVPADKLGEMQGRFPVSSAVQKTDGVHIRVVSVKQPTLNAENAAPSLEDAYLFATSERSA